MMQADSAKGRVCVVGAGVAGLVTGKVLRDDGFAVTLLTRDASPGGTWAAERVYPALKINRQLSRLLLLMIHQLNRRNTLF